MGNIVSTVIVDYPHVQILGIMKATVCTFVTYKLDVITRSKTARSEGDIWD